MGKQKEMEVKVLSSMINVNWDVLGDKKFNALNYGFYDFYDKSLMEKEEYEELLKSMRHKGLIEIEVNNNENFDKAIIYATQSGAIFLSKNFKDID